jgi:hypothetical protein
VFSTVIVYITVSPTFTTAGSASFISSTEGLIIVTVAISVALTSTPSDTVPVTVARLVKPVITSAIVQA